MPILVILLRWYSQFAIAVWVLSLDLAIATPQCCSRRQCSQIEKRRDKPWPPLCMMHRGLRCSVPSVQHR
jgi:hypothetical protein